MKKLNDLLVERSELINKMDQILKKAETENRKRTDPETQEWNDHNNKVRELSQEIDTLKRQQELNLVVAGQQGLDLEERKAVKKFSLRNAIIGTGSGRLEGLEREMHQEAAKEIQGLSGVIGNLFIPSIVVRSYLERANEETKTTGLAGGHLPLAVGTPSTIAAPSLYREIGATVYENLTASKIDLPFSKGFGAASTAEGATMAQGNPTKTKGTLTALRHGGWQKFTQDYLAESAVMDKMFADMIASTDRAISKALVLDAIAANVLTGFATSDTGAVLDWEKVLALISPLESGSFVNENFVMSKELFYKLAATLQATGSPKMILEGGQGRNRGSIFGIPAFGTSFLALHDTTKYDIMYGDGKEMYVGLWGGMQLLIDPFSASDDGYVKITFSRMAGVDTNPYAVASKRNAALS